MRKSMDKVIVFLMIVTTIFTVYYVGFSSTYKGKIESSKSGLVLQVGESYKLDVNNKSGEATYKSENEKVAKVDKETGNIVAVGTGKTKIIETINNEKIEYIVEVKKEEVKQIEVPKEETKDITEALVTDIAEQVYTGTPIEPSLEVLLDEKELEKNIDYLLDFDDNIKEGTSTVTVTGIGEYKGETTKSFEIEEIVEGEKPQAVITCLDKTYNGKAQTIASCSNGTVNNYLHQKVGEYTVTCKGTNGYSDAESKTCKINKIDIKNAKVDSIADQKYDGKEKKPKITVRVGTTELKEGVDYVTSYISNLEEGQATVTIIARGTTYIGRTSATFKIVKERTQAVITCLNNKYTGEKQVIAKCDGGTISQDNATHVLVGEYEVTCKGDTSHTDTKKTCKINKIDISNAKINFTTKQKYTGSPVTPIVTVTLNNKTLKKNEDYTVNYSNNTKIGTAAKVIITGVGNYSGTKASAFTIAEEGTITCTNPTYTGVEQTIATSKGCSKLNNAKQKMAGEYTVQCIGDSTHLTTEKKCVINPKAEVKKETPDIVLNKTSIKLNAKGTATLTSNQEVTYESKNKNVATVTAKGVVTGVGKGTTTIVATTKDKTKKKEVNVEVIVPITRITINTKNVDLIYEKGKAKPSKQIEVTSIEPKNADRSEIKWTSSNTNVATVDANGLITGVGKGEAIVKASYGTNVLATIIVKLNVKVTSVTVNPRNITLNLTNPKQATPKAEVTYSDGTKDSNVQWTSSNTKIVTVDQTGKITAVSAGETTIIAASSKDKNVKNTIAVKVEKEVKVQPTINIDASSPLKVVLGTGTKQLAATVTGPTKTVTWSSSNSSVVKVDQTGKITPLKAGTAEIIATISGTKISDKITVNIQKTVKGVTASPTKITINKGSESTKLAATVTYSDETKDNNVQWISKDKTIAEVMTKKENGKTNVYVKGVKTGSTTVEAIAGGKVASIPVTVVAPKLTNISFSDAAIVLETAKSISKLTVIKNPSDAKDPEIEWSITSGKDYATIDKTGKITATKKAGKVIVQAKVKGTNITATKEITVKKYVSSVTIKQGTAVASKPSVEIGNKITLTGVVTYTDGTTSNNITWAKGGTSTILETVTTTTDSTTKAITVTGSSKGTLTLTATSAEKTKSNTTLKQTITVEIKAKELKSITLPTNKTVGIGKTITLTPTYNPSTGIEKSVTWSITSGKDYATIDQNGKITGKKAGKVTVQAVSKSNAKVKATTTVTVQTAALSADKVTILDSNNKALTTNSTVTIRPSGSGNTVTLKAKVEPSTAAQTVTWSSSNSNIAKVDSTGKVTAVKQGVVTITAKTNNDKSTSVKVKVQPVLSNVNGSSQASLKVEYESDTLKYWLERPTGTHYVVTHIYVSDPVKQMKVALTTPKTKGTNYPRNLQIGGTIINNTIAKNNNQYKDKGLVAVNASPAIDGNLVPNSPVMWRGTADIPLVINTDEGINGNKVIRNSIHITSSSPELTAAEKKNYNYETYRIKSKKVSYSNYRWYTTDKVSKMLSTFNRNTYYLNTSTGYLAYKWIYNPLLYGNSNYIAEYNANQDQLKKESEIACDEAKKQCEKSKKKSDCNEATKACNSIYTPAYFAYTSNPRKYFDINDKVEHDLLTNANYTFGFSSVLVDNYKSRDVDSSKLANRQALCQIDKNNFILITSHLDGKSSESNSDPKSPYYCGPLINGKCPRVVYGLTAKKLADILVSYGCKTGFNLDGGGSTTYYYKNTKGTTKATRLPIQKENRTLADMLYFVEQ